MSKTKIFRIVGRLDKPHLFEPITFKTEISAAKEAHALEKIFAEMGSRHRAKRNQIVILSIEEIESKEAA